MEGSDIEIIRKQLGRNAENFRRVVKRCSMGFPVVIESFPEKGGKPFPTLYWLTCPYLRKEVSKLEADGWVRKFEEIIQNDENFKNRLLEAHNRVSKIRENLTENENIKEILRGVGSGGIRDLTKVKCLHLHLADFLAGISNPIGEKVWNMIKNRECETPPSFCKST